MSPIYQTTYNIISQSPFDLLAVFSCPIDGMIEPVVTGYPESLKATEFIEKVLKTVSNKDLEWLVAITDNKNTVSFQHLHFRVPESFLISCKSIYLLIQPHDDGKALVSLFNKEGVIEIKDIIDNIDPLRTVIMPEQYASVLLSSFLQEIRQSGDFKDIEAIAKLFD